MAKRPVPRYDFKAFGAAIKAAREGCKESRKKVGDEMFISPRYLANIENKGQHPSLQIFFELMLRYNISVDQFLLETPPEKNTQRRQLDALLDGMSDTGICTPAVLQLRGKILEFCQPGENLPTNVDQFIQPLPQILHVGGVDPAIFISGFGVLVQIVAAHLQEIRHAPQLRQVKVQAVTVQCHLTDIGTQATDAHAQHLFIDAVLLGFCGSQDDDLIPLFFHRASPSLS